jgi:long-chain acyl-CoA synthetase
MSRLQTEPGELARGSNAPWQGMGGNYAVENGVGPRAWSAVSVLPDIQTITGYLLRAVLDFPRHTAVSRILPDGTRDSETYAELTRRVVHVVTEMHRMGIARGDRVLCYTEEGYPLVIALLACSVRGAIPVPVSGVFSREFAVDEVGARVGACAVLCHRAHTDYFAGRGYAIMRFDDDGRIECAAAPPTLHTAVELLTVAAQSSRPDDVMLIQSTSGSSGCPKLVVRKHAAFARYASALTNHLGLELHGERVLLIAGLTHAFGGHIFTTCLKSASQICIPRGLDRDANVEDIRALAPTIFPMVPRMQRGLYERTVQRAGERQSIFGPQAKLVLSAGAPSNPELVAWIRGEGVEYVEFYGSSEASIVALTRHGEWQPGWAGHIVPDTDVRLAEDGELQIRNPGLFIAYWGDALVTEDSFTPDGYYRTGDLGSISPDGRLQIWGRKKDVFCCAEGSYIFPERIEQMLESVPGVSQAVLVGDGKPYLTAFLSLLDPDAASEEPDGFLDPTLHAGLYAEMAIELRRINAGLERVEQIVRCALFTRPFDDAAYRALPSKKVRRDRKAFQACCQARIAQIYSERDDAMPDGPVLNQVPAKPWRLRTVPGGDAHL